MHSTMSISSATNSALSVSLCPIMVPNALFLHLQDHKLAHKAEQDTADLRKGVNLLLKLKFLSNN